MPEVDHRIAVFIHRMENEIAEELDNIAVTGLRPPWVPIESDGRMSALRLAIQWGYLPRPLIDESKLAKKPD